MYNFTEKIILKKIIFSLPSVKMKNTMKEEMYEFIKEFKRIIKINKNKIPEYYLDKNYFSITIDKLDKNIYDLDLLSIEYIDFLEEFGKVINKYEIDINQIKKSILDKINEYCRLTALRKIVFSEEEDNTYEDELKEDNTYENELKEDSTEEEDNTYEDELKENNSEDEDNSSVDGDYELKEVVEKAKKQLMIDGKDKDNSKDNSSTNNKYEPNESIINTKSNESIIYELSKIVNIILEKAITSNNEELMNNS